MGMQGARPAENARTLFNLKKIMEKEITIKLTEQEHKSLCYMLDKGWDFLVDRDYFYDSGYGQDECYEVFLKITAAR